MEKEIELVACERCEKEFDSDYINNDFNGIFCPACQDELLQDDKDMRDTYKTC